MSRMSPIVARIKRFWIVQPVSSLVLVLIFLMHAWWLKPFVAVAAQTEKFGAPLVPLWLWLVARISPLTEAENKTIWLLILFLAQSVFVYLLTKKITRRQTPALIASFLVNLPVFFWGNAKLRSALFLGDAAHMAALVFFPLVSLWLLDFIREGRFKSFLLTTLGSAGIALMSSFALLMFLFWGLVIAFSEVLLGFGRIKLLRFASAVLVSAGLVAFWYNPLLIKDMLTSERGIEAIFVLKRLIPISLVLVPLLGSIGFLLFEKRPQFQPLFLALGLASVYSIMYLAGMGRNQVFAAEPERFLPELGLALALLVGISLDKAAFRLRRIEPFGPFLCDTTGFRLITVLALFLSVFLLVQLLSPPAALAEELSFSLKDAGQFAVVHLELLSAASWWRMLIGLPITFFTIGMLFYIQRNLDRLGLK